MKDNKLEDIAWRLIAEAKVERNPNRRRKLMQEAFELVGVRALCVRWTPREMRISHPTSWSGAPTKNHLERSEAFKMALEQRTVLLPTLFVIIRSINNQHDAGALGCTAAAVGSDCLSRWHV
jgi:hypothetical protein